MGLVRASASPVAPAEMPAQKDRTGPFGMCSSRCRKRGRKGNAKEKPRIAVNSASQRAARFRRQLTGDGPGAAWRAGSAAGGSGGTLIRMRYTATASLLTFAWSYVTVCLLSAIGAQPSIREVGEAMDRPLVQTWAALVTFVAVAIAAILLTNALISAVASTPSVTFSI